VSPLKARDGSSEKGISEVRSSVSSPAEETAASVTINNLADLLSNYFMNHRPSGFLSSSSRKR